MPSFLTCGACEPVCPVNAISTGLRITQEKVPWRDDNAAFFAETLPGRDEPLGSPGGAVPLGPIGVVPQARSASTRRSRPPCLWSPPTGSVLL